MNRLKRFLGAYKIASKVFKSNNESGLTIVRTEQSPIYNYKSKYIEAYNECPAVSNCVMKKAQAITNGKLIATNSKGEAITNASYNSAISVLQKPNNYQNYNELLRTIETMMQVYGAAWVYKIRAMGVGYGRGKVTGLIVVPNDAITIQEKTAYEYLTKTDKSISAITINLYGRTYFFSGEQLDDFEIIYDVCVNIEKPVYGKSRLDAISKNVDNIVYSLNSRNTIIKNRGAEGMITPEKTNDPAQLAISLNDTEKERIQKEYRKYGTNSNQWHTLISKVPLKYTKITRTPTELGLFDGENADYRTIAMQFGVPVPLLGLPDTTKFNTYSEAKKEFYEDTIIPEARVISDAFNNIFESQKNGYSFAFDFSFLSFMQEDEQRKAQSYNSMSDAVRANIEAGILTLDEGKQILNEYV